MNVASEFVKNLKVLAEKRKFTEEETKLIVCVAQEMAGLSPFEVISLLENIQICIDESLSEMLEEEFTTLKKELFEEE